MAEPLIIYSPALALEVREIAERFRPAGFGFEIVQADALPEALRRADYLMGFIGHLPSEALAAAERLKLVQLMSVGYDTLNLEGARAARVPVAVNGGANAIAVAEHAIMFMLATLKHLTELNTVVHGGQWRSGHSGSLRLYELWHSTVGIVGMGRIGQQVARRLQGWDARLVYFDPYRLPEERERELGVTYLPFEELLQQSDVVSVHVPLSEATRHLFNARTIGLMKPTAVLVNTSRGELVDEAALAAALRVGALEGAGLDVFAQEPPPADHPFFGIPNAILTPHVAGPTWQSWPRRFENCFANIARVERGEQPQWVVPELQELLRNA
jgi:phosphoglycerate dehydrogenase-like enzyme